MYEFLKYNTKLKPETIEELGLTEFKWFWHTISNNQFLSEPFIENWTHKVFWYYISRYQNLSLECLIKHKDKINLKRIKFNQKIPQETKDKFLEITNKNI